MRYREQTVLRTKLRQLVDDVEPSHDALPRLLARTQRRNRSHRVRYRVIAVAGLVVGTTAVVLMALLIFPVQQHATEPVSVRPNSYIAQAEPGVIASFDIATGNQIREVGHITDRVTGTVEADRHHVYATVSTSQGHEIVRLSSDGGRRTVRTGLPETPLAAEAGRLAYLDHGTVVVLDGGTQRRLPLAPGDQVIDLALDPDGRLAILTRNDTDAPPVIRVSEPDGGSLLDSPPVVPVAGCGTLAITWSDASVGALLADCDSSRTRVATLDPKTGQPIGAGVPFTMGQRAPGADLELSADRLGRFLLSTSNGRQWLIDGSNVTSVPRACAPSGSCARTPSTFRG